MKNFRISVQIVATEVVNESEKNMSEKNMSEDNQNKNKEGKNKTTEKELSQLLNRVFSFDQILAEIFSPTIEGILFQNSVNDFFYPQPETKLKTEAETKAKNKIELPKYSKFEEGLEYDQSGKLKQFSAMFCGEIQGVQTIQIEKYHFDKILNGEIIQLEPFFLFMIDGQIFICDSLVRVWKVLKGMFLNVYNIYFDLCEAKKRVFFEETGQKINFNSLFIGVFEKINSWKCKHAFTNGLGMIIKTENFNFTDNVGELIKQIKMYLNSINKFDKGVNDFLLDYRFND